MRVVVVVVVVVVDVSWGGGLLLTPEIQPRCRQLLPRSRWDCAGLADPCAQANRQEGGAEEADIGSWEWGCGLVADGNYTKC